MGDDDVDGGNEQWEMATFTSLSFPKNNAMMEKTKGTTNDTPNMSTRKKKIECESTK